MKFVLNYVSVMSRHHQDRQEVHNEQSRSHADDYVPGSVVDRDPY